MTRNEIVAEEEARQKLADEISQLARELTEILGRSHFTKAGEFLIEYEDSRVCAVWSGPESLPSDTEYRLIVRRRPFFGPFTYRGSLVTTTVGSKPAVLSCGVALAEEVVAHLRRIAALKCYCCGRERPRYEKGWAWLETNLVDVAAPEKVSCSAECVERWSRRNDKT